MQLTQDQIDSRIALSTAGLYASWYLRESQLDLYELILREQFPFMEAARRFGKTNSILCFVIEQLRMHPGWIARWCFPFKNQAREVLIEEMRKIQTWTPEHLKFKYKMTDSVFVGPNYGTTKNPIQSKLYIRGVNEDKGESARGPAANILIADEYGFWLEAGYVIKSALFPQLEKQDGQWLIKTSTPPPDLGHIYYLEREEAIRRGRFLRKTIYDNEALTEAELQIIIDECGGVQSESFRRERLCEDIKDASMQVIPEWENSENVVDDDYPRPDFFTTYIGGDSGADDNTALVFGYYDFVGNERIVEDEIVVNGLTTAAIMRLAKIKELELWSDIEGVDWNELRLVSESKDAKTLRELDETLTEYLKIAKVKPRRRAYDASKQLIYDIYSDHKYPVTLPEKDDKLAAIHNLRVEIGTRRFKVKKRCTQTIRQLDVGRWKDERHTDFQRDNESGLGHLDAIAACIYFNRIIDPRINPIPQLLGVKRETHFVHPNFRSPCADKTTQTLASVFGTRTRKRR
jgi:hypothetical protein